MGLRFEREIRRSLGRYLAGELSLSEFQEWFVPRAWDLDPSEDALAYQLVGRIELLLAEASSGHWTEMELRENLESYTSVVEVRESPGVQTVTTSVLGKQPLHATIHVGGFPPVSPIRIHGRELVPVHA